MLNESLGGGHHPRWHPMLNESLGGGHHPRWHPMLNESLGGGGIILGGTQC
jgi:hypothetical protein